MARYRGNFTVAANYEPLKAAPFDARALVESKADLILPTTWQQKDGGLWIYSGMIVSVGSDIEPENNGVYVLLDAANYTNENSWRKLADVAGIEDLQNQINEIEVGGGSQDVEVETEGDLPLIGAEGVTYYVIENQSIWRWQAETESYISFGGGAAPELDIQIINGGNANGTN